MGTVLFSLHLSRHVGNFGKPSVHSERAALVGCYVDGVPYHPKREEVRNALPHYYRRAFDRAKVWWFDKDANGKPAHITLLNSRGKYLNTLYALPYVFTVTTG